MPSSIPVLLEKFEKMTSDEVQKVGFEIAILGMNGLDVNDSTPKYRVLEPARRVQRIAPGCHRVRSVQTGDAADGYGFRPGAGV